MNVIDVENVSICYLRGNFKTIGLKEYIIRKVQRTYSVEKFWADKDINFKLQEGDFLGIIGANGAGKSTLLKAITGVMEPSTGVIRHVGNISSLLELSGGFDQYMTVRENTYLRGALLGYTREFMNEKYEEIIQFAELEDFQDYRFRQLSSGMRSRLAFSVASLLKPDILILDEVLSVGDGAFRKKSETKMREIISTGVTVILVSHSLGQIREMCNKVLWLHKGRQIAFSDDVQTVCDTYDKFLLGEIKIKGTEIIPKKNRLKAGTSEQKERQ